MSLITLRPAVPTDQDFLLKVYARTRANEMKRVDWDAAQKEAFLRMQFALVTREKFRDQILGTQIDMLGPGGTLIF
jgi:hypothetical protein